MAEIIVSGSKEELAKVSNVLKGCFPVFSKRAVVQNVNGVTAIIETHTEEGLKEELTDERILESLTTCSNRTRNCAACAYLGVENCVKKLSIDAAVVVARMCASACKPASDEDDEI